jgi:hypothetical protein
MDWTTQKVLDSILADPPLRAKIYEYASEMSVYQLSFHLRKIVLFDNFPCFKKGQEIYEELLESILEETNWLLLADYFLSHRDRNEQTKKYNRQSLYTILGTHVCK